MKIMSVGIDLAKNVFQVHAVDEHGAVVLRKQLRRDQVTAFFANAAFILMQACGGSDKSDSAIPAKKPANQAGQPVAEWAEQRAGTKGNTGQPHTRRTQSRDSAIACHRGRTVYGTFAVKHPR